MKPNQQNKSLRNKILAFVCALTVLSLAGSTVSLYRITEVSRILDGMNRVAVPLGRHFTQIQSDADILKREFDRNLGNAHWNDPHWRARPVPRWILEVLESEIQKISELLKSDSSWADWSQSISQGLVALKDDSGKLVVALDQKDSMQSAEAYSKFQSRYDDWRRNLQWGALEFERHSRETFGLAQARVSELRTGLETVLFGVVALSLLLLWLGERAIRPLAELTKLAREITRRGLKKGDTAQLPAILTHRNDEVSALAREFHQMALQLLEREKIVENQKTRLEDQNLLLRQMGALNESVLESIRSILVVIDSKGKIVHANPVARLWFCKNPIDTQYQDWPDLALLIPDLQLSLHSTKLAKKLGPFSSRDQVLGGHLYPLPDSGGVILVLDDLTDEMDLQERLRIAENLAAIGKMSAQVAHEVRNPLHSIGLEAELALELATTPPLRQALQSILSGVDRLEKITDNYLRLSKTSHGRKEKFELSLVLENVLATYSPECESQGVSVDWKRENSGSLEILGDQEMIEQALGNLFRNALQALVGTEAPKILWKMGSLESGAVFLTIEDNGPGIPVEIRSRLFTPFATTRAQGTGLGLSFVKKVMEDHGGSIRWIETSRGARFDLIFSSDLSELKIIQDNRTQEGASYAPPPVS